jgi:hypothetical protein
MYSAVSARSWNMRRHRVHALYQIFPIKFTPYVEVLRVIIYQEISFAGDYTYASGGVSPDIKSVYDLYDSLNCSKTL